MTVGTTQAIRVFLAKVADISTTVTIGGYQYDLVGMVRKGKGGQSRSIRREKVLDSMISIFKIDWRLSLPPKPFVSGSGQQVQEELGDRKD